MHVDTLSWGLLGAGLLIAVLYATLPVLLAALGGLLSDLAGCINVALEGSMLLAAFFGVIASVYAAQWMPGLPVGWYPWIGCLVGLFAAWLLSLILAFFHLECGADLIVAGIALNLLGGGLTIFLLTVLVGDKGSTAALNSPVLPSLQIPIETSSSLLNTLFNGTDGHGHHVVLYIVFLLIPLLLFFLRATRYGTWLRAVGENPEAALSAGIPVKRMQYLALSLSGLLAGLGGIYLSMGYLSLFQADMTAGRGFLALAAIFMGRRCISGTSAAALFFGVSAVLVTQLGTQDIAPQLIYMLPPLVTLLALILAGKNWKRRTASTTTR